MLCFVEQNVKFGIKLEFVTVDGERCACGQTDAVIRVEIHTPVHAHTTLSDQRDGVSFAHEALGDENIFDVCFGQLRSRPLHG